MNDEEQRSGESGRTNVEATHEATDDVGPDPSSARSEVGHGGIGDGEGRRDAVPSPADGSDEGDDVTAGGGKKKRRKGKKSGSFWKELPILVVIALVLALVIKTWLIQPFYIPSASMENTLKINDRVLVNKLVYHTRDIERGDVVVFNGVDSWDPESEFTPPTNPVSKFFNAIGSAFGFASDEKDYIKRVIGLPGDRVRCCDARGHVTVNGHALDEKSYLYPGNAPSESPFDVTVPKGRLWVMGDHRQISYDSRQHLGDPGGGTIPESKVIGRAFVRVWPLSRFDILSAPDTFSDVAAGAAGSPAPATPLALGVLGALPLTWLQRRARVRLHR